MLFRSLLYQIRQMKTIQPLDRDDKRDNIKHITLESFFDWKLFYLPTKISFRADKVDKITIDFETILTEIYQQQQTIGNYTDHFLWYLRHIKLEFV